MSIPRILSECPTIQRRLGEAFTEVGQREQLPLLEYINSEANTRPIKVEISPGAGKLREVQVRWKPRLPETEVEEGASIKTCTSTNVYGDLTKTYTLDTTDTYVASQLIDAETLARHCQDNSTYVLESIMDLMDALDRRVASALATQAVASIGSWGTEVDNYFTVNSDFLQIATRQTGGQALNEFALADILQATTMANYPAFPVVFGGAEMRRYANAVQAGCCTQYGIDLAAISNQNGFAFAYDARLADAFGSQLKNIATIPGAMQWVSYNLAQWNSGITPAPGANYSKVIAFTPAGLAVDLTLKDECSDLSIVVAHTGKLITLPDDIYEASDKYAGVNYVNGIEIVNP